MKTHHTPGPWHIQESKRPITADTGCFVIIEANALIQSPSFDSSAKANARLIAAAPELLEALRTCSKLLDLIISNGHCGTFADITEGSMGNILAPAADARAAIQKATGEQP